MNRKVVLGVTSSGTSKIGNCGGIDNPTHYTRSLDHQSKINCTSTKLPGELQAFKVAVMDQDLRGGGRALFDWN